MGKVTKAKPQRAAPSIKSRAARRASPPTEVVDIAPKDSDAKIGEADLTVLAARQGSGISKKKQKQKPLSRQQRLRKEKVMARADAVIDQLEKKKGESKRRGKKIKDRSAAWEDVNGTKPAKPATTTTISGKASMDVDQEDEKQQQNPADALVMDVEEPIPANAAEAQGDGLDMIG